MTREEAIHNLNSLVEIRRKYADMQTMKNEIECLEMAIEALKAEPCGDCVSREAVMQALTKLGYGDEENGADAEYMSALCDVAEKVKALQPVTPKPLDSVLDEIKTEIEDKSYLSYDDNPRHIIDESWVLEIIDKYRKESDGK